MSADTIIDKDKWWSVRGGFFKDMMNLASARTPDVVVQHLLGYSAFVGCLNISSYGDQNIRIELCRCFRVAATEEIEKLRNRWNQTRNRYQGTSGTSGAH